MPVRQKNRVLMETNGNVWLNSGLLVTWWEFFRRALLALMSSQSCKKMFSFK